MFEKRISTRHTPRVLAVLAGMVLAAHSGRAEVPAELQAWLTPQSWQRDTDGPVLSLGASGQFDDTHVFAPAVIRNADGYWLYYCGSQGVVDERVFRLGLATSTDGREFVRHPQSPVFEFDDQKRSVLTAAFLRAPSGAVLREDGKLRMWFSSTDFQDESGLHTLHETSSTDGLQWAPPSEALLNDVYAPTILRDANVYRMWYVDVSRSPWIIRHARSNDGRVWRVTPEPCVEIDQGWETGRLFYPTVRKMDRVYVMWYGSYWTDRSATTATGFAVSLDGYKWYKHPGNPVHRPAQERAWESHYVTSQSVLREPDGSVRMWYASRKQPPFVNKYFAINTAVWKPGEPPKFERASATGAKPE